MTEHPEDLRAAVERHDKDIGIIHTELRNVATSLGGVVNAVDKLTASVAASRIEGSRTDWGRIAAWSGVIATVVIGVRYIASLETANAILNAIPSVVAQNATLQARVDSLSARVERMGDQQLVNNARIATLQSTVAEDCANFEDQISGVEGLSNSHVAMLFRSEQDLWLKAFGTPKAGGLELPTLANHDHCPHAGQ